MIAFDLISRLAICQLNRLCEDEKLKNQEFATLTKRRSGAYDFFRNINYRKRPSTL